MELKKRFKINCAIIPFVTYIMTYEGITVDKEEISQKGKSSICNAEKEVKRETERDRGGDLHRKI